MRSHGGRCRGRWRATVTLRKRVGVVGSWRAAGGQLKGSGTTGLREGPKRRKPDSCGTDARRGLGGDRTSVLHPTPKVSVPSPQNFFFNTKMPGPPEALASCFFRIS